MGGPIEVRARTRERRVTSTCLGKGWGRLFFFLVCSEFFGEAPPPSGSLCCTTVACGMQGLEEVHEQDFSDAIFK